MSREGKESHEMEERKFLKVNLDELCSAMEDSSEEHAYYLNLETGEILFTSDYMDEMEAEKLSDVDEDPERYEPIPKTESYEGYQGMGDFIATVEDAHLAELLEVAIDGKGAFRRFEDVLVRYPEQREKWFRFRDERIRERALGWLKEVGVRLFVE